MPLAVAGAAAAFLDASWAVAAGALALAAVGVGAWLASRTLSAPIEEVARTVRALAERIPEARSGAECRRDELGDLATAVNDLAMTLAERGRARETLIRDTSHDMRSRLTALLSEVEAMRDGIVEPGPTSLDTLHGQVMWLSLLLENFQTLAHLENGGGLEAPLPVAPLDILDDVANTLAPLFLAAGIDLEYPPLPAAPWVTLGNPARLYQVFTALLENALRHTDAGGRAVIGYESRPNMLMIRIDDSAPGVPSRLLPALFRRAGRAATEPPDGRRNAGMGLVVCAAIVRSHGGTIVAAPSALGGLRIEVSLPNRSQGQPS